MSSVSMVALQSKCVEDCGASFPFPPLSYECSGYLSNANRLCNSLMDQSRRQ